MTPSLRAADAGMRYGTSSRSSTQPRRSSSSRECGRLSGWSRSDRHQVDAAAAAGPVLLRESATATHALHAWVEVFVDLLTTKHGLADALHGDTDSFAALHRYFIGQLVPVCADLLDAAAPEGSPIKAYALLRGIGNLCIGGPSLEYAPAQLAHLLVSGVLTSSAPRHGI